MFDVSPPPLPGDQVGPYVLGPLIGVGGNATVYQGSSDATLLAAIKILHPGKADTDEARRFQREFQTLQQLHHNGIVRVYESGLHGDYPWIAMEFVDGIALNTQIDQWRDDPTVERFEKVEEIFRELCQALAYVHKRGLIHRDIKPSNVLLTRSGRPKLTDFGVVKAPGRFDTQLTVAGRLVGTVAFMAPEQIMGDPVDARADLYSLGAVLYLMLTLKKPIEADSIPGYLARHLTHTPEAPSEVCPGVPPHLEQICAKLLMKDPSQRYASADQLIEVLDEADADPKKPFYGREKLLLGLMSRLEELVDGGGGVVVISGADGMGKTSLLENLLIRGAGAGHDLVFVAGGNDSSLSSIRERLQPRTPVGTLSSDGETSPPWTLIVDDLDALSAEDVQFLTAGVRDLVAIEGEPILVIVSTPIMDSATMLSSPVGAFCSGTTTGLSAEHVVLQGLERAATVALVRGQGLVGSAGSVLGNRLFDDCNGHPGEILDQMDALIQEGWLQKLENGTLGLGREMEDLRQSILPVSAQQRARIVQHLARLTRDARAVLDVLVVFEMEATPMLLVQLADLSNDRILQACRVLQNANIIHSRMEGIQEVIRLQGHIQHNHIYALIDREHRAAIHKRVASALQRRGRRRAGSMAGVLAHHLLHSGQVSEAYPLLLVAAQSTLRSGRRGRARRLLRLAVDAQGVAESGMSAETALQNRRLLYMLEGEIKEQTGDLTGAISSWEHALAAALNEGNEQQIARMRSGLGLAQAAWGEPVHAALELEQAVTGLQRGDPMWSRVAGALAEVRLEQGRVNDAEQLWRKLHRVARVSNSVRHLAQSVAGLGLIALIRGELEGGRDQLVDAIHQLRGTASKLELCRYLLHVSELALVDGQLESAVQYAEEVVSLSKEIPRVVLCVRAKGMVASALAAQGKWESARGVFQEARTMVTAVSAEGVTPDMLRARLSLARACVLLGHVETGRDLLDVSPGEIHNHCDDPVGQLLALRARLGEDPRKVRADAMAALDRVPAGMVWFATRIALDVASALQPLDAAPVLQKVLPTVRGPGLRLLMLEASLLAVRIGLGTDHGENARQIRDQLQQELGASMEFLNQWR